MGEVKQKPKITNTLFKDKRLRINMIGSSESAANAFSGFFKDRHVVDAINLAAGDGKFHVKDGNWKGKKFQITGDGRIIVLPD